MTGTIKTLSRMSPSGFITAENGLNVYFERSAVLPHTPGDLAAGQSVSFELDGGKWPRAINIRLKAAPQPAMSRAPEKHRENAYLQYVGFEQTGSIRVYRFRRIARGEDAVEFEVTADLTLFAKHRVGIQEGPVLCVKVISAVLDSTAPAAWPQSQLSLTDTEMLAHVATRSAAETKHSHKRAVQADNASA